MGALPYAGDLTLLFCTALIMLQQCEKEHRKSEACACLHVPMPYQAVEDWGKKRIGSKNQVVRRQ